MKDLFPGYYNKSEKELEELWSNALFVFDTNIFLSLYRYSETLREKFFAAFEELMQRDQLWIPHQVALEYQRNRIGVIQVEKASYDEIKKTLKAQYAQLKTMLQEHQFIEFDESLNTINETYENAKAVLEQQKTAHPHLAEEDPILERLEKCLQGRIGKPYSRAQTEELIQEAKQRCLRLQAPGFKDERYGDQLLWFQMLDHGKATGQSFIFITDDRKPDWWDTSAGKLRPHPDLAQEILQEAGGAFYMYQPETFIREAQSKGLLKLQSNEVEKAVEEILEVREAAENETESVSTLITTPRLDYERMMRSIAETPRLDYERMMRSIAEAPRLDYERMMRSIAESTRADYERMMRSIAETPRFDYEKLSRSIAETPRFDYDQFASKTTQDEIDTAATNDSVVSPGSTEDTTVSEQQQINEPEYKVNPDIPAKQASRKKARPSSKKSPDK